MHFRIRQNVIQLIRTNYVAGEKKPKADVVGRLPLADPQVTEEIRLLLLPDELQQLEDWIKGQHRLHELKEEYAAFTLAEHLVDARRWLRREKESDAARAVASDIQKELVALRKVLKSILDDE